MSRSEVSCSSCGTPATPDARFCSFCGQKLEGLPQYTPAAPGSEPIPATPARDAPAPSSGPPSGILFRRIKEPREGAFTVAAPEGWTAEGGIFRADLMNQVVDAQSMEAKVDFTVKRDPQGCVLLRWCPEVKYCDPRYTITGRMGWMQPGSSYQGMLVAGLMPAAMFLAQVAFPWAHPQAGEARVVSQQPLPDLAQVHRRRQELSRLPLRSEFDAALVTFEYLEHGARYHERAQTVIENMGQAAAGMWSNKETVYWRAPAGELEGWEPLLKHIRESGVLDPTWQAQEQINQQMLMQAFQNRQQAEIYRAQKLRETQQYVQQVAQEIVEHRQRVNAEIRNDAYLTLTGQEEYVNPYTREVDVGSNQWKHRWVTDSGDEFYTDEEWANPNDGSVLNRSDWKRTPVRPRYPQQ